MIMAITITIMSTAKSVAAAMTITTMITTITIITMSMVKAVLVAATTIITTMQMRFLQAGDVRM